MTIERDRLVPVPEYLVRPVEVPMRPEHVDTIALGAYAKQCRVRLNQANGQLAEIGELE